MTRKRRERWYGIQGQSYSRSTAFERSSGLRKLASLVVLLVLVVILIQQASDVKKVGKVATMVGLLTKQTTKANLQQTGTDSLASAELEPDDQLAFEKLALVSTNSDIEAYRQIWSELLKSATTQVVETVARKLYSTNTAPTSLTHWADVISWRSESLIVLKKWRSTEVGTESNPVVSSTSDSSPLPAVIAWFESHPELTITTQASEPLGDDHVLRGLWLAIDRKLLEQVLDSSPWKSAERIPFVRSWQRIEALRELIATQKTGLHAFQHLHVEQFGLESNFLRGRPIRFDGTIVQSERTASVSEPGFTKIEYQVLWLKPDDESNQPVCVYVPKENVDENVELKPDTRISLVGCLFKRLAYASQRGGDVAPLLLAAYVYPVDATVPLAQPNTLSFTSLPNQVVWSPPVDWMAPFAIVRQSVMPSVESLSANALNMGFRGLNASEVLKPFLAIERVGPEIDRLTKERPHWALDEHSSLVRLSGMVTKVERVPVDNSSTPGFESSFVYRCTFQPYHSEQHDNRPLANEYIALSTSIPSQWMGRDGFPRESIHQPCILRGVGRTQASEDQKISELLWVRPLEWRLDADQATTKTYDSLRSLAPGLNANQTFLLEHRWNLTWLDLMQDLQSDPIKPLSQQEMEPYFSLMAIAKKEPLKTETSPENEKQVSTKAKSVPDLLGSLMKQEKSLPKPTLERVEMQMRIVRVTRVRVDDATQIGFLGSDHYFQLDCMADIGNRSYEIKTDSDPVVYRKEYPVTCVSIDVPNWLLTTDETAADDKALSTPDTEQANEGDSVVWFPRKKAVAKGWCYRYWSYKTKEISSLMGENKRQVGPLVVIDSLQRGIADSESENSKESWPITNLLTTGLGILGTIGIWWYVRSKTKRPR